MSIDMYVCRMLMAVSTLTYCEQMCLLLSISEAAASGFFFNTIWSGLALYEEREITCMSSFYLYTIICYIKADPTVK